MTASTASTSTYATSRREPDMTEAVAAREITITRAIDAETGVLGALDRFAETLGSR